jgi:O-antigen/teichoic acid export membrane protein
MATLAMLASDLHSMITLNALRLKVLRSLEIDRAVFFAIAGKIWSMCAGLITVLLIAAFFSPELQGFYYTFNSVVAFQVFAELGLGTVLTYYASHEWAKLAFDRDGRVTGDADALSRLISLGRFALRWYLAAGAAATLVLAVGGLYFFGMAGDQVPGWEAPWIVLCVVTGLNLCVVPIWALLEGCNQVSSVYAYRLIQYVASSVAAWVAIYLGAGLWVASIIGVTGLLAMILTAGRRYGGFVRTILLQHPKGPRLNWRVDILPMQWRISLGWISGYFTFSWFTPVLFHYQGSVVAGQMGMTCVFALGLAAVASSWVIPRAPGFGILIAQQKYVELDRMLWRVTAAVVAVTAVGALGIWTLVYVLGQLHHPFAGRLLPPAATGYLLVGMFFASASLPMATYLRAHKKEPLLALSVINGLLTGIVVVVLGKYYSADGVAIGYLAVVMTLTPFVALIWYRRRAEWHAAMAPLSFPREDKGSGAALNK